MPTPRFDWRETPAGPGRPIKYVARSGRWPLGSIFWDGSRPRSDIPPYKATVNLPGLQMHRGHFATIEEAQKRVEDVVKAWFSEVDWEPE